MKLLLTSGGITNKSLARALKQMVNGPIRTAFIPTAANVEDGEKDWLINDLNNFQKMGRVDIVDISAMPKSIWLPRLKKSNVIAVGGGNTTHLMKCINSSGLKKELPSLLKNRVYVGISAGSCVMSNTLQASSEYLYGDESKNPPRGLGLIKFNVRPHLNSSYFPKVNVKNLENVAPKLDGDLYAIDDQTGVLVHGSKITVVSEGKWKKFSKK
jgi:dipeptidase E